MLVSIITAIYNNASTLEETITSVLSQTWPDIEYWIIDGGSDDGSVEIIKRYEPLFKGRMHWLSEPDKGVYDAMNKGISRCRGDIVGMLNSDDHFTSDDVVERIVRGFSDDIDAVFGDVHYVSNRNPHQCVRYYSSARFRPALLRWGYMPAHPSFYARREVYEKYGLYSLNYEICADYDIMVRLFWKHKIRYKYLNFDFVTMRTGGISTANMRNRLKISLEDVKACRAYGMFTCFPMICMKYLTKVFEFRFS